MRRAAWLLLLAPLSAAAEGSRREKVEAVAEQEARRADELATRRQADRLAAPMELAMLEALASDLGLELLVPPVSKDAALERQRRLEALRAAVYPRLEPLEPAAFVELAEGTGAETRAIEHRLARLELVGRVSSEALRALDRALEDDPRLRVTLFVHGQGAEGVRRERALRAHLARLPVEPRGRAARLSVERSGLPRAGATIHLVRLASATE